MTAPFRWCPRLGLALACLVLLDQGSARAAFVRGITQHTLDVGGHTRSYWLRVPARYDGSTPMPLVLDLHGFTSSGGQQAALSKLDVVAEREGFVVAYPDGLNNAWNAGICCGNPDIDDVGFLRALVAAISADGNIDAARVYATGLSNGGAMSQRLACDAADLFAAAAPMAFPIPARPLSECRPSRAMPVLTFMGLTDTLVAYTGGPFPSAADTFAYWRDINGCGAGEPDQRVEQGMSRCETYTHCTNGVQAGLCSITAQAFGTFFDGHILYFNPDFNLAEVAWAFLSQFRLPDAGATPVRVELSGPATLAIPPFGRVKEALRWTVTLGDGTWTAEDGNGTVLSGSALPGRRNHHRFSLGLTGDSQAELLTALAARLSELAGADISVTLAGEPRLAVRVAGRRRRVRLVGRLVLAGQTALGAANARWVFRLSGRAGG